MSFGASPLKFTKDSVAAVASQAKACKNRKENVSRFARNVLPEPAREYLRDTIEYLDHIELKWAVYSGLCILLQPELDVALSAVAERLDALKDDLQSGPHPQESMVQRTKAIYKLAKRLQHIQPWADMFREEAEELRRDADEALEWTTTSFACKLKLLDVLHAHFANVSKEIKPAQLNDITQVVLSFQEVMTFAARPAPDSSEFRRDFGRVENALGAVCAAVPALTGLGEPVSAATLTAQITVLRATLQKLLPLLQVQAHDSAAGGGAANARALERIAEENERGVHHRIGRRMAKRYGFDL